MFYHWSLHLIWSMLWAWSEICEFCYLFFDFVFYHVSTMFVCVRFSCCTVFVCVYFWSNSCSYAMRIFELGKWIKRVCEIVFWFCLTLMVFQWRFRCLSMSSWWWDWWVIELCLIGYEWIPEEKLDRSRFRAWLLLLGLNIILIFLL
jgi:hypothetical protein